MVSKGLLELTINIALTWLKSIVFRVFSFVLRPPLLLLVGFSAIHLPDLSACDESYDDNDKDEYYDNDGDSENVDVDECDVVDVHHVGKLLPLGLQVCYRPCTHRLPGLLSPPH